MSVTNIHIKISELQSEIGQALNSAYATGYCNGRADAIDEFVAFKNTMPTVEEDDGYIRPMTIKEIAEQLKEKKG